MKKINQLTAAFVKTAKPGRHGDGAGLYLEVAKGGGKSWVFMWNAMVAAVPWAWDRRSGVSRW